MLEWEQSNTSKGASVWSTFPRNPYERHLLVFALLTIIGILALTSLVAVYSDIKTDGYGYHAARKELSFS